MQHMNTLVALKLTHDSQNDLIKRIVLEKSPSLYKYITTMICIAVKGEPIVGVIHKPFEKITSWAWVKKGMSEDLKQTKV